MEKKNFCKILLGIIILISWMVLFFGITYIPAFIWILLVIITFVFYIGVSKYTFRRRQSTMDVIRDMEDYMEKKAEEQLGEKVNTESQKDEDEEKYEFDDDIEIIKK